MDDYFRPWRRKLGVITLLLACVFAAGWIRSFVAWDHVQLSNVGGWYHDFISTSGIIQWESFKGLHGMKTKWVSEEPTGPWGIIFRRKQVSIKDLDHRPVIDYPGVSVIVAYCLIVIPLTLLSAYLLLSKPRSEPRCPPRALANASLYEMHRSSAISSALDETARGRTAIFGG